MAEPTPKNKIIYVQFLKPVTCGPLTFSEWTPSRGETQSAPIAVTVEEKGNHIVLRWTETSGVRKFAQIPLTNVAQVTKLDD